MDPRHTSHANSDEPHFSVPDDDMLDSLSVEPLKSPISSRFELNDDAERESNPSHLPSVKSSISVASTQFSGVFQPFINPNSSESKGDLTPGQVSISENQPVFLQSASESQGYFDSEQSLRTTSPEEATNAHLINRLQNIHQQNEQPPPKRSTWAFPSSNSLPTEGYGSFNNISDANQPLLYNGNRIRNGQGHLKYGSGSDLPKQYPSKHYSVRNRHSSSNRTQSRALDWLPFTPHNEQKYDDDNKQELVEENNGLRVWYDDYTSIDWIHDYVKERVRLRRLRSMKGIRGWIANNWDASQAWILVTLIGVCAGCVAAGIDVFQEYFSDLKTGYCSSNIFYNHKFCCWYEDPDAVCYPWKPWSTLLTYETSSSTSSFIDFFAYCSWGILFAFLAAILVYFTAEPFHSSKRRKTGPVKYYAAGSGVPEVKTILGGFVIRGFLGIQTLWVKAVGLALATSSGMNLGKEGPLVHIACCIGNISCRLFNKYNKNEAKRREMLSASAAAGVSVAFGAPIGGVLFSLEEVSYYFPSKTMWRSFLCALVGSMTLKLINPFRTGKTVLFEVTFDKEWHNFEMVNYLVIGIFGGLLGAAFCKLNLQWSRIRRTTWLNNYPVQEVLGVALISVVLNYFNPYTKMGGPELVAELFSECVGQNNRGDGLCSHELIKYKEVVKLLALAIIQKFFLTVITFGLKVPCGVFIPSLAIGSCFGRLIGLTAQYWQQTYPTSTIFATCGEPGVNCFTPGVYAMVGAAATLAGVTRMTLSLVVIVFELTGSLGYALPLMLSVLVAKWVADALEPTSIYENLIELNDYPFLDNKREYLHTKNVVDVLESNLEFISINEPNSISKIKGKINRQAEYGYADGGFPILDGKHLVGYIASNDMEYVLEECTLPGDSLCLFRRNKPVSEPNPEPTIFGYEEPDQANIINGNMLDLTPFMDQAPLSVPLNASMEVILELFIKLGVRYLCVVDNGHYVGVIHKKRLLAYLHEFEH